MTASTRRRLSRADREQSFFDAAAALVARVGPDAVTMEGVAAELGVNKALGYRYFKNRDALLLALFERETAAFDTRVASAVAAADTLEGRIRAVIETYLDELGSSSLLVGQFEVSRPASDAFEKQRRDRVVAIVTYVAELFRVEYDLSLNEAVILASILSSGSQGVVGLVQDAGWNRKQVVDVYVEACIGAIEAVARNR